MAFPSATRDAGTHFVVVPHTHWDREWYRPFEDFRRRLVRLVDRLLTLLDTNAEFRCFHFDGQTITLDDYVAIRPHEAERLRVHLRAGRIHIGPWRVLPDEFLVTGEALIRNLQQGHEDCARWGVDPIPVGYTPDQFGHVGVLPQILAGFGLPAGVVWRGVGPDVQATQFLWESPDGTRLFTIYLPGGYGNGTILPARVEPLIDRLEEIRREQAAFCTIPSLLVMNGSDHVEPQGNLPALFAEVAKRRPEWTFEMGDLATFVEQARAAAESLTVHRGEFRHPWRANLLPGVTSVRTYQKQTDFRVCRLFEKYVEPMSAWADRLGDGRGAQDFIDYAWRLIIENHPHDSICGCSVDAVHDEMDTRWMKVEQVGTTLQREALRFLSGQCDTAALGENTDQALVTYTAARPRRQAIDVELYLDDPNTLRSLRDAGGVRHAVQLTPYEPELFFETQMPVEALRIMVAGMAGRDVLGYYMNNLFVTRADGQVTVTVICGHQPYGDLDLDATRQEVLRALADDSIGQVHVLGISATRTRLQAVLPVAGQTGVDAFAFSAEPAEASPRVLRVDGNQLETADFLVDVLEDGSVRLHDKRTGRTWDRALTLVDDGDRGDTYNFDPVAGGAVVRAPVEPPRVTIVAGGPVAGTLAVEMQYRVPAELGTDRAARVPDCVDLPVRVEVTCYRDLPRVDFRVTIDNRARDHRVRAEITLPFAPVESIAEGPFGVVRRPAALPDTPDTVERFYGTAPTKGFVCVEDAAGGMGLVTRGIQEYEVTADADTGTLALTLLRCVGWLSRDDLEMRNHNSAGPKLETPGAQSPGVHTFEFALLPYAGDYAGTGIPAAAHAYAYPPIGTRSSRHTGTIPPGTCCVRASDPQVVVSALGLTRDRQDLLLRVYNEGEGAVDTAIALEDGVAEVVAVDLRERAETRAGETVKGPSLQVRMTPSQLRSWRVRRPRAST